MGYNRAQFCGSQAVAGLRVILRPIILSSNDRAFAVKLAPDGTTTHKSAHTDLLTRLTLNGSFPKLAVQTPSRQDLRLSLDLIADIFRVLVCVAGRIMLSGRITGGGRSCDNTVVAYAAHLEQQRR